MTTARLSPSAVGRSVMAYSLPFVALASRPGRATWNVWSGSRVAAGRRDLLGDLETARTDDPGAVHGITEGRALTERNCRFGLVPTADDRDVVRIIDAAIDVVEARALLSRRVFIESRFPALVILDIVVHDQDEHGGPLR